MVIACSRGTVVASEMFGRYCNLLGCHLSLGLTISVHSVSSHSLCLSDPWLFCLPFLCLICLILFAVFEVHHPSMDSIPGWALPALGGSLNSSVKLSIVPFICPGIWCLPLVIHHDIVVFCYLRCRVCSSASVIHFVLASGSYRNTCLGLIPTSQTSQERRCLEHGQSHSSSVHNV